MPENERLAFMATWLDNVSGVAWTYQLMVYPASSEVELFDVKNRRVFLRKTKLEGLKPELYFIGATCTLLGRQLKITDYGDEYTRRKLSDAQQRTLAIIKPDAVAHTGQILQSIEKAGFLIGKLRMCHLSKEEAATFYQVHNGKQFFDKLTSFMSSGSVVAMEVVGKDSIAGWRGLLGPTNSEEARSSAPQSIRARFGSDGTMNACHGSDAPDTAAQELNFFFGPNRPGSRPESTDTTLAIIKPHAIADRLAGKILSEISRTFEFRSLEIFNISRVVASEFFEVYRGVVAPSEFTGMVEQLTSGPCLVMELASKDGKNAVEPFRQLCGPADPEVGCVLRKDTLRARFGLDRNKNAVHCTDLLEDGPLEVNYFFKILQAVGQEGG